MSAGQVVPLGRTRPERADAARNREALLCTARAMMAELGADKVTMDGLAERSGLGKGTVFRRFGSRAGIFQALFESYEMQFQERVITGPAPLGPGVPPVERLVAYGRARIDFLLECQILARAALERTQPIPAGEATFTRVHLRMLLGAAKINIPDLDSLALQLTAALEGPVLLYLTLTGSDQPLPEETGARLGGSWESLVLRLVGAD